MTQKKELKPSEHATRALSGVSQGVRGALVPGFAGLGLLALAPLGRKITQDTSHVPPKFKTETVEQLADLSDKLLRAGGRNPDVGRKVILNPTNKPGFAEVIQEYLPGKGRSKARDILRVGRGATPESIAHEVGHITPTNRFSKALSRISPIARHPLAQALPSLLAATSLLGKPDEEAPMVAKSAPFVGGAQLAAILGEEVRANTRASKLLKSIGYKPSLKQTLGRHALALPYLRHAALLVGAPLGILKGVEMYNKAREKGIKIPPAQLLGRSPEQLATTPTTEELKKKWAPLFESK